MGAKYPPPPENTKVKIVVQADVDKIKNNLERLRPQTDSSPFHRSKVRQCPHEVVSNQVPLVQPQ